MFNTKTIKEMNSHIIALEVLVNSHAEKLKSLESTTTIQAEKLAVFDEHLESYLKYKVKKESDDVYLEILTESFDPETGIELKLDWNDAAINYLKRNGFTGPDDESIVEKWVYTLFKHAQHKTIE